MVTPAPVVTFIDVNDEPTVSIVATVDTILLEVGAIELVFLLFDEALIPHEGPLLLAFLDLDVAEARPALVQEEAFLVTASLHIPLRFVDDEVAFTVELASHFLLGVS